MEKLIKKTMKKIIKNTYIRKKIVVYLYNLRTFFYKRNKKEKDVYDYMTLLENKRYFCKETYQPNIFYGISNSLKIYSNYNDKIECCIEHGLYFGDFLNYNEAIDSGLPALITFGEKRKEILRKLGSKKIIIEIGPYINYAKPLLSDEKIKKQKEENGKTLLVFPAHSIDDSQTDYNMNLFVDYIERIKKEHNFKTVLVCLYFRDIELGRQKIYKDKGYIVCSAGRREDKEFLSRQKTYLLLSDYVLSNSVGTHVGYSIFLKKPQSIYKQTIEYNAKEENNQNIANTKLDSFKNQKEEISNLFTQYNENITKQQIKVCNKYFGLDKIKTPEELHFIFDFCKNIAISSKHKESNFLTKFKENYENLDDKEKRILLESNEELLHQNE